MPRDFHPENEMERAFVQSNRLDAKVVRKRADENLALNHLSIRAGQLLSLVRIYAMLEQYHEQRQAIDSLLQIANKLDAKCQRSLCRICESIAYELFDEEGGPESNNFVALCYLLLKIVSDVTSPNFEFAEFAEKIRCLQAVLHRQVSRDQIEQLKERYKSLADMVLALHPEPLKPRSAIEKVVHRKIITARGNEKLQMLHWQLAEMSELHGMRSAQVSQALVELLEFYTESGEMPSLSQFLDELMCLCADDAIELTSYQLRRVYILSAQLHNQNSLFDILEKLERDLFLRREASVGYDGLTFIALNRLVEIWQVTDKLAIGQTFCQQVAERANRQLESDNLYLRQLNSAQLKVQRLLEQDATQYQLIVRQKVTLSSEYSEPHEFALGLTLACVDSYGLKKTQIADDIFNELLNFYFDCVGESARKTGEISWLLMETDARRNSNSLGKLVKLSIRKCSNSPLARRMLLNVDRLIHLIGDDLNGIDKFRRALAESNVAGDALTGRDNDLLHLICSELDSRSMALQSKESLKSSGTRSAQTKILSRYLSYRVGADRLISLLKRSAGDKPECWRAIVWLCTKLAIHADPVLATRLFDTVATIPGAICVLGARPVMSFVTALSDAKELTAAERVLQALLSWAEKQSVPKLDDSLVAYQEHLFEAGLISQATALLRMRLAMSDLSADNRNRLRIRLAMLLSRVGDAFEAGMIVAEVFANIPDAYRTDYMAAGNARLE